MRWLSFFILAYLVLGVQLGIGAFVQVYGAGPNLPLLAVVFVALNAPAATAALAGVAMGLMQDVATAGPLGLFAFGYGLAAAAIARAAEFVRRGHPLTQTAMTLGSGLGVGMLLLVHERVRPTDGSATPGVVVGSLARVSAGTVGVSTLYTTLLAPIGVGLLQRFQKAFAFARRNRV